MGTYDFNHLSPTQINTMLRCEMQYEFSYVMHMKRVPPGILILGSTYHTGVEHILRGKLEGDTVTLEEATDVFSDEWEANLVKEEEGIDWTEDTPNVLKDAGVDLTKMYHQHVAPNMNPTMVEAGWIIQTDTVPVKGFIDMVREDEEGTVITDHKIGKKRSEPDKHFLQLCLYSIGLEEDLGLVIDRSEIQLAVAGKKMRDIEINPLMPFNAGDKMFVKNLVNLIAKKIQSGLFAPTGLGTWACSEKWCGYWDMCRGRSI